MDNRVKDSLVRQGVAPDAIAVDRSIDLRYIGQLHSVTVPLTEISEAGFAAATAAFHDEHLRQYRYSHPDVPVETSALRVAARGTRAKPDLSRMHDGSDRRAAVAERERPVHFGEHGWVATRVVDRNSLGSGDEVRGPAIVDQLDSTIVLPPGTAARVDEVGNVIISTGEDA
jgi:N-methylhydantoinase A